MLVVDMSITAGERLLPLELLTIQRLEPLDRDRPLDDQVHPYEAITYPGDEHQNTPLRTVRFTHRYGDGAWKCTLLALQALEES